VDSRHVHARRGARARRCVRKPRRPRFRDAGLHGRHQAPANESFLHHRGPVTPLPPLRLSVPPLVTSPGTDYTPKAYSRSVKPDPCLPLTPVVFEIMLALAAGERHGYDIMQDVERRTDGRIVLHAGTLYRALSRLLEQKLIEELDERPVDGAR